MAPIVVIVGIIVVLYLLSVCISCMMLLYDKYSADPDVQDDILNSTYIPTSDKYPISKKLSDDDVYLYRLGIDENSRKSGTLDREDLEREWDEDEGDYGRHIYYDNVEYVDEY